MSRRAQEGNRQRTVFIGNISFDGTEDELRVLFSSVGPIANLRLVVDRDTGKRKGFGFAEYNDSETAISAVRNLNDFDFHGRSLRVNLADQDAQRTTESAALAAGGRKRKGGADAGGSGGTASGGAAATGSDAATTLRVQLPPPLDPVASYLDRQGRAQMFELVLQAKHYVQAQPEAAARLFASHPPVYHALQLAIDRLAGPHWPRPSEAASGVTAPDGAATSQPAQPQPQEPEQEAPVASGWRQPEASSAAPEPKTEESQPQEPEQEVPIAGGWGQPQPASAERAAKTEDPSASAGADLEQTAASMGVDPSVLAQLLQLTPEQLTALPEEQRAQVLALQQTLRG